jgi:hypothetical protein
MTYLAKAARRLRPIETPAVRPAMFSRSPIAEADQRLNLDFFAADYHPPVAQHEGAETLESGGAELEPDGTDRPPAKSRVENAAGPPRPTPELPVREDKAPRLASAQLREPAAPLPRARPSSRSRPQRAGETSRVEPASSTIERVEAAPQNRRWRDDIPPVVVTRPQADEPRITHPRQISKQATKEQKREKLEGSDAVRDAIRRAMAWVAREPVRSREESTDRAFDRPFAAPVVRESRPVTYLEIGKIEVEVVPPPANPVRASRPGRASRPAAAARRFGWRQR